MNIMALCQFFQFVSTNFNIHHKESNQSFIDLKFRMPQEVSVCSRFIELLFT